MNSSPVHYRPGGHTGKHSHRYSEMHALDSPAVCQKGPEQQHPRINYAGHLDLVSKRRPPVKGARAPGEMADSTAPL